MPVELNNGFLRRVKSAVLEVEPSAEVYLYGSRARGEAHAESDWDFLVLVDGSVDYARKGRIRHRLYEIEWDVGCVISSVVRSRKEWSGEKAHWTPFRENVRRDSIAL